MFSLTESSGGPEWAMFLVTWDRMTAVSTAPSNVGQILGGVAAELAILKSLNVSVAMAGGT
jgi:hypothetical protein